MSNLITWKYWFSLQPEPFLPLAWNILNGTIVLFIVSAVIFAILKMRPGIWRGLYKRLYAFSLTGFIIGLLMLFFNYEQVPFFMARFWLIIWLVIMVVWLFFILRDLRSIPQKKKELTDQQELKKYLP